MNLKKFCWRNFILLQVSILHASKPYNPNIANVFYLAGFIESWGRGIEIICVSCRKDNLPVPEFIINPGDIMVKFAAPEDRIVYGPGKVTDGVTDRVTDKVTDTEKKILETLRIDPGYSYVILAEKLGVSKKTIAEHIKNLKNKGIIERIGNNKKGYWKINR